MVVFSEPIPASSAGLCSSGQTGADNQDALQECSVLPQTAWGLQERLLSQRGELETHLLLPALGGNVRWHNIYTLLP